ncbi:glyoxylase-like metal-dependent hydrolase (beta-lactamase superfamily II) [Fontibacillus phaseoli]|uniref:Glyoxylase-like metal-dependent hydrolase (Beta-lactamase superfamily II) n=1 Tax=Fontibacillus phaseoli TaxID=1416533 RepID=A0A369AZE0_9BACL|nr:MBL fold metallo-hydrolase [Fontibacillus phaseoli]RCX12814.1 glyoxylase-like metal-dependent hydrolase (beta-lactamase superfamily II) [Fontibacillus phaseoli]
MRILRKDKLIQITFMPRMFPVNCYLIEEEEGVTLIDAALPYSVKGILRAVATTAKPLTRIILTHAHDDHVGALDAIKGKYPNIQVYISERDARLLEGDVTLDDDEPQTPIRGGVPKKVATRADVLLAEGDRVGSLLVVSSSGHTPGSISLLDTRSGALVVGDAFQTRGGIAVSGVMRPLFPFPAMATWNFETALRSARKLADLKPSLLAAGHGSMISDPVGDMEKAIGQAEIKLAALQAGRKGEPRHVTKSGN